MKQIFVHTIPNSRKNELKIISDQIIRAKIAAPPIDGQANRELIKLLSKHFKIHRNQISVIKGITADKKIVEIA